jgi:hypothetical protein
MRDTGSFRLRTRSTATSKASKCMGVSPFGWGPCPFRRRCRDRRGFLDLYDGTPPLESRAQRRSWVEVCSAAFLALRERTEHGRKGFLREYAATNEAEFFAVATETFYEQPRKMAEELPELYALLAEFYNLDLAAR